MVDYNYAFQNIVIVVLSMDGETHGMGTELIFPLKSTPVSDQRFMNSMQVLNTENAPRSSGSRAFLSRSRKTDMFGVMLLFGIVAVHAMCPPDQRAKTIHTRVHSSEYIVEFTWFYADM